MQNVLSRRIYIHGQDHLMNSDSTSLVEEIRSQLSNMDASINTSTYDQPVGAADAGLYKAKHAVSVYALRIYLIKTMDPLATPTHLHIQEDFTKAIAILKANDMLECANPPLCWPLIILACSTTEDEDFHFLLSLMEAMVLIIDPANASKLRNACSTLLRYRSGRKMEHWDPHTLKSSADFLLKPWLLNRTDN